MYRAMYVSSHIKISGFKRRGIRVNRDPDLLPNTCLCVRDARMEADNDVRQRKPIEKLETNSQTRSLVSKGLPIILLGLRIVFSCFVCLVVFKENG